MEKISELDEEFSKLGFIFRTTNKEKNKAIFENNDFILELKLKGTFTEKGTKVLDFLKSHLDCSFSSSEIGEALGSSSRSISGSLRPLISNGYVKRVEGNPNKYSFIDKH